jgi:3-deoxy-D-manno-octulosonate 8-phosphate phosphatase (KDO 8-P phosphatase)
MKLETRCQRIELILSDVDGVLTDGGILFDDDAVESKRFHVRDGMGIKLWRSAGYRFGIITGRSSRVVANRAGELNVDLLRQGVKDKRIELQNVLRELGVDPRNTCFIGDDLPDLPAMLNVGLAVAVADAADDVRQRADYVTQLPGGSGAVRETIETILKCQARWNQLIEEYATVDELELSDAARAA